MVLTEEQQDLIKNNLPMLKHYIRQVLRKRNFPKYLVDEFISRTYLHFCISAGKFDKKLGFKFSTYAYGGFNFALKKAILAKNKAVIFDKQKKSLWEAEEELEKIATEKEEKVAEDFLYSFIEQTSLREKEKKIVVDYYLNGLSFPGIGEKYGMTKQGACYILQTALKKLQEEAGRKHLMIEDFYKKDYEEG